MKVFTNKKGINSYLQKPWKRKILEPTKCIPCLYKLFVFNTKLTIFKRWHHSTKFQVLLYHFAFTLVFPLAHPPSLYLLLSLSAVTLFFSPWEISELQVETWFNFILIKRSPTQKNICCQQWSDYVCRDQRSHVRKPLLVFSSVLLYVKQSRFIHWIEVGVASWLEFFLDFAL